MVILGALKCVGLWLFQCLFIPALLLNTEAADFYRVCVAENRLQVQSECPYLWTDVDSGLEGPVVVFGQELVKEQVELLFELDRVCSQGSQLYGAVGKQFLGLRL